MKKIVFIDIDGTLRNSKSMISETTKIAVSKFIKQGNLVVLSTGRPLSKVIPIGQELEADLYAITSNGAVIYDFRNDQLLHQQIISFDDCQLIYRLAKKYHQSLLFHTSSGSVIFLKEENKCIDCLKNTPIYQAVLFGDSFSLLLAARDEIEQVKSLKITNQSIDLQNSCETKFNSDSSFFDINHSNVSKMVAIEKILSFLDLPKKQAIAIGDGVNDLPMFQAVGTKIAMGNAISELKAQADIVTLSNDEDGVASFLETLM